MLLIWTSLRFCRLVKYSFFTTGHHFRHAQTESICRRQNKCDTKIENYVKMVKNTF